MNQSERDAVKAFLTDTLGQIAVELSFDGKDTRGIKDAKDCVDRAFQRLEEAYGERPKAQDVSAR